MTTTTVQSPLPGVFYRRPSPDSPPYVREGERVEVGSTIGLVEIMKQFSEITAPASGTLLSFAVEDGEQVDPGALLATIEE